jgi:hypothetical protein
VPDVPSPYKILYVPCTNPYYGSIDNEVAVIDLLQRRGVHVVDRTSLSTADRINLFRHTDVVIGPLGEGLTDILFCRPGALLWEWMPRHHQNASFNRLAQAAALDYSADLFESVTDPAMSGPWQIDSAVLDNRLSEIESRLARVAQPAPDEEAMNATAGADLATLVTNSKPVDELMLVFEGTAATLGVMRLLPLTGVGR